MKKQANLIKIKNKSAPVKAVSKSKSKTNNNVTNNTKNKATIKKNDKTTLKLIKLQINNKNSTSSKLSKVIVGKQDGEDKKLTLKLAIKNSKAKIAKESKKPLMMEAKSSAKPALKSVKNVVRNVVRNVVSIDTAVISQIATLKIKNKDTNINSVSQELNNLTLNKLPIEQEEVYNFKSNKKFINIARLIKDNKLLDLEKMLKSNEINPNQRDDTGASSSWTPLYWSVKLNKIECVELLLINGADVNLVVNDPFECYGTALDLATLLGHEEIETVIRKFMNKDGETKSAFKAVRTKLRGNAPAFNFKSAKRQRAEMEEIEAARKVKKDQEQQKQEALAA